MEDDRVDGGAILLARQVFESDIFVYKPAIWFKIWVYILGHVFWKEKGRLKRGQGYFTYKKMMDATGATRDQVKHLLGYLREVSMVHTQKAPHGLVLTVLNYDRYQDFNSYSSPNKSPTEALSKPDRSLTTKEEGKKGNESNNKYIADFNNFKQAYPKDRWEKNDYCKMKFMALCKQGKVDHFRKACQSYANFMEYERTERNFDRTWMLSSTFMNNWKEWYEKDFKHKAPF